MVRVGNSATVYSNLSECAGFNEHCRGIFRFDEATGYYGFVVGVLVFSDMERDDDRAMAAGIELVYGREAPHLLCQFHLLREYRRNVGCQGLRAARALLGSGRRAEAEEHAGGEWSTA